MTCNCVNYKDWRERTERTDVQISDSELLSTLDSTFTAAATAKQFVVNAVTVTKLMLERFWTVLSFRHWGELHSWFCAVTFQK